MISSDGHSASEEQQSQNGTSHSNGPCPWSICCSKETCPRPCSSSVASLAPWSSGLQVWTPSPASRVSPSRWGDRSPAACCRRCNGSPHHRLQEEEETKAHGADLRDIRKLSVSFCYQIKLNSQQTFVWLPTAAVVINIILLFLLYYF